FGDGGGDRGDVAHLGSEIASHEIDVVGQVLPGSGHALDLGLATQLAFGAHLAGHTGDFRSERIKLVHHGVDRVLQLENFTPHIDGDLFGQIAVGDGGGDGGDIAHLGSQVAGHEIDIV